MYEIRSSKTHDIAIINENGLGVHINRIRMKQAEELRDVLNQAHQEGYEQGKEEEQEKSYRRFTTVSVISASS